MNEGECEYCGLPWAEHRPGVKREITWPCVTAYRAGLAARNADPEVAAALEAAADQIEGLDAALDARVGMASDPPDEGVINTLTLIRAALAKLRS